MDNVKDLYSTRIAYTKSGVEQARSQCMAADDWATKHADVKRDLWVWQDIVETANRLFERTDDLDVRMHSDFLETPGLFSPDLKEMIRELFRLWLSLGKALLPHVARLESEYGSMDGTDKLRNYMEDVEGILTPDEEFFSRESLECHEGMAIHDFRTGNVTELLECP